MDYERVFQCDRPRDLLQDAQSLSPHPPAQRVLSGTSSGTFGLKRSVDAMKYVPIPLLFTMRRILMEGIQETWNGISSAAAAKTAR